MYVWLVCVCVRVWVRLGVPLLTLAWSVHTNTDILESGMLLWYEHARSHPQLRLPADLNAIIKRLEPAQEVHIITSQPQLVAPSPNTRHYHRHTHKPQACQFVHVILRQLKLMNEPTVASK